MAAETSIPTARQRVARQHKHPVNQLFHDEATLGERVADRAASGIGSWWFLGIQSVFIAIWIVVNSIEFFTHRWDVYPFILLNLAFTIQAAFTGPVIERNTKATLQVLDHLKKRRDSRGGAQA